MIWWNEFNVCLSAPDSSDCLVIRLGDREFCYPRYRRLVPKMVCGGSSAGRENFQGNELTTLPTILRTPPSHDFYLDGYDWPPNGRKASTMARTLPSLGRLSLRQSKMRFINTLQQRPLAAQIIPTIHYPLPQSYSKSLFRENEYLIQVPRLAGLRPKLRRRQDAMEGI